MGTIRGAWALLALGGALAAGPIAAASCTLNRVAELPVTMAGLSPIIPAKVNGKDVRLIADSGAFFSLLTPGAVQSLGLRTTALPRGMTVTGLNGAAEMRLVTAHEFTVVGSTLQKVDFLVGAGMMQSEANGLLGRNILGMADTEYDLANGAIRLFKPSGCKDRSLAYWVQDKPLSVIPMANALGGDPEPMANASVNGVKIRVAFDTGASLSVLSARAAARAGVRKQDLNVPPPGMSATIGQRPIEIWKGPFDSFKIGGEEIRHTTLRVADFDLPGIDMLLGADFFLSHRVYVAASQDRIYFTYNGGRVFSLDAPAGPAKAVPAADPALDAASLARRGAASTARRDFAAAIADLGRAIELEPKTSHYYRLRGAAYAGAGQTREALADVDKALALQPNDVDALMERGSLRLESKDLIGGRADLEAAARLDPSVRLEIGSIYVAADLLEPAVAQLDQWIAANARDDRLFAALNTRCWARALWGRQLEQGLADCNLALKRQSNIAAILDSRGLTRLRLGQYDAAIADYDQALKLQPKSPWSLYGRGLAKRRLGRKTEGDSDLAAALALQPSLADEAKAHGLSPEPGLP